MSIGYACKTAGIFGNQIKGCTLKSATPQRLEELIAHNIKALRGMLEYNAKNNIRLFRICSDMIPFASHPDVHFNWRCKFERSLADIGRLARELGIRMSMHPGQYSVLNSPDDGIVERAIADIGYHADFLDSLGADGSSKIILHIGGAYGDKHAAAERFERNFYRLPKNTSARVAVENDERCFSIDDVIRIGNDLGISVVFDVLHHQINPGCSERSMQEIIKACAATWKARDGKQKIHYSQQKQEYRPGMHSNTIFIEDFLEFYKVLDDPAGLDIMLEVKDKNLSALKCMHCTDSGIKVNALEQQWAKYKYTVLAKSPRIYNNIRSILKQKEHPEPFGFYKMIEQALYDEAGTDSRQKNALQHVWSSFSREAAASEKLAFFKLMDSAPLRVNAAKNYLQRLAIKYDKAYLLDSYYFSIN